MPSQLNIAESLHLRHSYLLPLAYIIQGDKTLNRFILSFVIFINGLCLMVLEMVGARLLAPWLGTSIVVWTSLIGVILAFLSLGYWLGGQLADKTLTPHNTAAAGTPPPNIPQLAKAKGILSVILLCASLFVMVTAFIQASILSLLSQSISSLHIATLVAAICLFAIPSVLFGMVSPYIMRVAITSQQHAGATIGKLNAIATIGSIVGTFLGGFVLVAWFGSQQIVYGIGACLLATSALIQLSPITPKLFACALLIGGIVLQIIIDDTMRHNSIITLETPYNTVQVIHTPYNGQDAVFLRTDPTGMQSGMYIANPTDLMFDYTQQFELPTALNPHAKKVLMLGGGGYSIPRWLLAPTSPIASTLTTLDVVEIDPGITSAAHTYFALPQNDKRLAIYHEDARIFVNRSAAQHTINQYDLIFADVFNSYYSVPFQAGTVEAATNTSKLLTNEGIFMMNIISAIEGERGMLFRSIYHAYAKAFPYVYVFPADATAPANEVQNIMLMATKAPLQADSAAKLTGQAYRTFQQQWTQQIMQDVPPLTDNFAPVDRYLQYSL